MKKFYTVKEAAEILHVSTNTIYSYLDQGSLKGKRLHTGGRFKIPYSELSPYITEKEEKKVVEEAVPVKRVNGLSVLEIALGVFLGFILMSLLPDVSSLGGKVVPMANDILIASWSYSGRTSSSVSDFVGREAPKLASLFGRVESIKFAFNTRQEPPEEVTQIETPKEEPKVTANVLIKVPAGTGVNLRSEATSSGKIVGSIKTSEIANKIGEEGDWVKVEAAGYPAGWVSNKFIADAGEADTLVLGAETEYKGKKVLIGETPAGFLKVRSSPGGLETARVYASEVYEILDKSGDWYFIDISATQSGWISSQFATIQ